MKPINKLHRNTRCVRMSECSYLMVSIFCSSAGGPGSKCFKYWPADCYPDDTVLVAFLSPSILIPSNCCTVLREAMLYKYE